MSNGMIHIQRSFCEFARAFNKFWLVESWFLDMWSSGRSFIAQWTAVVRWLSAVQCICCHWTMFPKINFQPIRICLTHAQIHGMTVEHVSLHSVRCSLRSTTWSSICRTWFSPMWLRIWTKCGKRLSNQALINFWPQLSQLMRLWYLSHRRPEKAQASLRWCTVSPEPSLFPYMKYRSTQRVWPKIRHLVPLDSCACAFEEWIYGGRKEP